MSYEQFGREIGDFLRGLLDVGGRDLGRGREDTDYSPGASPVEYPPGEYRPGAGPYHEATVVYNNPGAKLKPGHLLITYQSTKSVYQVDPESGQVEYLFTLARDGGLCIWQASADRTGNIYCTYSGIIRGEEPFARVKLGVGGGLIRLNHRILSRKMPWLPEVTYLAKGIDPVVARFLDAGRILVTDMDGFGNSGSVFIVNLADGSKKALFESTPLLDPVASVLDETGTCWIANGDQVAQDGELLRLDPDGKLSVVMPRLGEFTGCMVDVLQSQNPDELIVVRDNLPRLDNSSIVAFNKKTNKTETLLSAKPGSSRFFSLCHVDGSTLWTAESVTKKILQYDLGSRKVVNEIDISSVGGRVMGIPGSFDVFESISVIPHDLIEQ